jgi:glycosyltransferase involved in cell wall biosynthesis
VRVGVDGRHAGLGLGVGTFVRQLVGQLVAVPGMEVVWFGAADVAPSGVSDVRGSGRYYPLLDTALGRAMVGRAGVDVFHFTGNTGWSHPGPVPFVLTIHDLIYMNTGVRRRSLRQVVGHRYLRLNVPRAARAAARIAVPSRATAADVVDQLRSSSAPVVIQSGIDRPPDGLSNLRQPYVAAFAAPDPRKGIEMVLEGLRLSGLPHRLVVFAGGGLPRGFDQLVAPDVAQRRVELLGYLPRDEMWRVLRGASALVYPSTAEGFGMPVVEAMAVDVPVIAGLSAAVLEMGGDAIARIDPASPVDSIAESLRRICEDSAYGAELVSRGRERVPTFSWQVAAQHYAELYREAADTWAK